MFRGRKVPVTLFNAEQLLRSGLDKSRSGQTPFQGLTIQTAFKALLFRYVLSILSSQAKLDSVKVKMSYTTGNLVGILVQGVSWSWSKLFQRSGLSLVRKAPAPYILFDGAKVRFSLLFPRDQIYSLLTQDQWLRTVGGSLNRPDSDHEEAFDMSLARDDGMRYFTYIIFDRQPFLLLKYSLYKESETWLELKKFRSQDQAMQQVFKGLP